MEDKEGRTELHNAIIGNMNDRARELIFSGELNLNAQDNQGYTALHAAAQCKNVEITKLLLSSGANPNLLDAWGNTPLWRALGSGTESAEIIKLLLDEGVDPEKENDSGVSVVTHIRKIKNHPNRQIFEKYL